MLSKRLISCLDVRDGKLAKSVKFVNTRDIGDPVATARRYYEDGIDELVFYDITASSDNRGIMLDVVSSVASQVFIPFSVGGGLRTVEDCAKVLLAGAEKVNVNTAAVSNPRLIADAAHAFGAQCVVLSMDVLAVNGAAGARLPGTRSLPMAAGRAPAWTRSNGRKKARAWARESWWSIPSTPTAHEKAMILTLPALSPTPWVFR